MAKVFGKTERDRRLAGNYQKTLNSVRADRVKNRAGRTLLTDRSDSQIAEDPERVSTAQGC